MQNQESTEWGDSIAVWNVNELFGHRVPRGYKKKMKERKALEKWMRKQAQELGYRVIQYSDLE